MIFHLECSLNCDLQKFVGNVWDVVLSDIMIPTIAKTLLCRVLYDYFTWYYFLFYE